MGIVDVDSHVTEPPDLWTSRVSSKWGDKVPHVKWVEDAGWGDGKGQWQWFIGDAPLPPAYASASKGFALQFPLYARTPEETEPGAWDAEARLKIMDEGGIDVQALYGNIGGFGSEGFLKLGEPELMEECARAYNDFIIDFISVDPKRFIPLCVAPVWDVDLAVREVQRSVARGHKGVSFSASPNDFGFPGLADRYWEPLWSAIEECDVPLSFHIGSGDMSKQLNAETVADEGIQTVYARSAVELFFDSAQQLTKLLYSGILARHPGLRFICAESGIGWLPFALEAADYHYIRGGVAAARPDLPELPSTYFRQQCAVSFWFEQVSPSLFEQVGIDNVVFETDYPHPTSIWKDEVTEHVQAGLGNQAERVRDAVLSANARRIYKLDS